MVAIWLHNETRLSILVTCQEAFDDRRQDAVAGSPRGDTRWRQSYPRRGAGAESEGGGRPPAASCRDPSPSPLTSSARKGDDNDRAEQRWAVDMGFVRDDRSSHCHARPA